MTETKPSLLNPQSRPASPVRDYKAELPPVDRLLSVIESVAGSANTEGNSVLIALNDQEQDGNPTYEDLTRALHEATQALGRIYEWSHVYRLPSCIHVHAAWFDGMLEATV